MFDDGEERAVEAGLGKPSLTVGCDDGDGGRGGSGGGGGFGKESGATVEAGVGGASGAIPVIFMSLAAVTFATIDAGEEGDSDS